jgi:S1-C subfamily serine protease
VSLFRQPSFLALAAVLIGGALVGLPRVQGWEEAAEARERRLVELEGELERMQAGQAALLSQQSGLEDELEDSSARLVAQSALLTDQAELLARQASLLEQQDGRLEEGFDLLDGMRESLRSSAQERAVLAASLRPDGRRARLQEEILRPVFQIAGVEAVGSAVLLRRGHDEEGEHYLALSCYHVLRDIVNAREGDPHEVVFDTLFDRLDRDEPLRVPARMIAENPAADLALLRLDTADDLGPVARIAPLERLDGIEPFSEVYTVGCPLGTSAQATRGEVTRTDWTVGDEPYWMVSSPAYFGNSGGGVFLQETNELVGIFSKIYTHGSYRPQVVTHMGLAVPLDVIHAWLTEIGHAALLPPSSAEALEVKDAASPAEGR